MYFVDSVHSTLIDTVRLKDLWTIFRLLNGINELAIEYMNTNLKSTKMKGIDQVSIGFQMPMSIEINNSIQMNEDA